MCYEFELNNLQRLIFSDTTTSQSRSRDSSIFLLTQSTRYTGVTGQLPTGGETVQSTDGKATIQYLTLNMNEDGIDIRRQKISFGWSHFTALPNVALFECEGRLRNESEYSTTSEKEVCGSQCVEHYTVNQILCICGASTCMDHTGASKTMAAFNATTP